MQLLTTVNRLIGRVVGPRATLALRRLRRGELAWLQRLTRKPRGVTLNRSYDVLRIARENLAAVREQLERSAIECVELPHYNPLSPRVVVRETDLARVTATLRHLPRHEGWTIEVTRAKPGHTTLQVYRRFTAPDGTAVHSRHERVIIEPWRVTEPDEPRVDGGVHTPGTLHRTITRRNTLVEYFTPHMWQHALEHGGRVPLRDPHLFEVTEPIDIVYTWVDGDDAQWIAKKNAHLTGTNLDDINASAVSEARFMSRDELKYSLRSVEAYASWVNHIYIVTDGQTPAWLDTSHPKITVVDHRDIFTDTGALPVFNSHAIESQLHHIAGLQDRYLYMNDDVLLMRPVRPELFFTSNGHSKFFLSTAPLDLADPSSNDMPVLSAAKHGRAFIRSEHARTVTNKFKHAPHPQLRRVFEAWEESDPHLFARVARSKFRHPDDVSLASSLYHYHAYAQGHAIEGSIRYAYVDIATPGARTILDWWMRSTDIDTMCINDTGGDTPDTRATDDGHIDGDFLPQLLEQRFPIPSSFELHP